MFVNRFKGLPRRLLVIPIAASVALGGGALIAAAEPSNPPVIYGCVSVIGTIRIVPSLDDCKRTETPVQWNTSGGPSGPIGPTGETGPSGPSGPQGETGAQGIQGIQGLTGETGPSGPTSPEGATGAIGPQGIQGLTGETGPSGPSGLQGETGAQGIQGIQGLTGETGPSGPTGPQGVMGVPGMPGPMGMPGPAGMTGPSGPTGPQGVMGVSGPMGPSGPQGLQGETGPSGPAGPLASTNVTRYVVTAHDAGRGFDTQSAMCQPGDAATGGGVTANSRPIPNWISSSMPVTDENGNPVGWSGSAYAPFDVYVVCAQVTAVPQ